MKKGLSLLLSVVLLFGLLPVSTVSAVEFTEIEDISLDSLGFEGFYIDISDYLPDDVEWEDIKYEIEFVSYLDFKDTEINVLYAVDLDEYHTFILYEYEDEYGYIDIVATIVITTKLVAIATFAKWKNPTVISRLSPFVSSSAMRAVTNTRAGQLRSALRPFSSFTSSQAMQDTVFRAMVNSGVSPADARAIGVGVTNVVRWSR